MKIGMRKPSIKKSIKARTTGKVKRKVKKAVVPGYGKKGMGWIKSPKKALYNKVYKKTTFSITDLFKGNNKSSGLSIIYLFLLIIALPFLAIYGIIKLIIYIINRCRSSKDADSLSDDNTDIQAIYSDNQYQIETENTLSGIYNESSSFINSNDGGKKKMGKGKRAAVGAVAVALVFFAVIGGLLFREARSSVTPDRDTSEIFVTQGTETDESTTQEISRTSETETRTGRNHSSRYYAAEGATEKRQSSLSQSDNPAAREYVLNTYRMKFHYPTCDSVTQMSPENREYYHGTREEIIAKGYSPCGNCKP